MQFIERTQELKNPPMKPAVFKILDFYIVIVHFCSLLQKKRLRSGYTRKIKNNITDPSFMENSISWHRR